MKRNLAGVLALALGSAAHLLGDSGRPKSPSANGNKGRSFEDQQAAIEAAEDKRKRRAAKRANNREK